jgi:DNA-binding beta-propeller fold protein YncE
MNRRELLRRGLAVAPALLGDPAAWAVRAARSRAAPLALVTADTEAHVVVVALVGGAVRARVRTLEGPRSIERAGRAGAVVGHPSEGAISLLEGSPLRVRRVLRGFSQPRYTAVTPDGRLAYVTDSGHGELAVVDLVRGRVVRRTAVGAHARHLSLAPSGRRLWVSLGSSAETIAVVDLSDRERPRVSRHVRPPFLAHDVGFAPDGRAVWVTAGRERRMAIYRPDGRRPARLMTADEAPQHVGFARGLAFVTSGDGGTLQARSGADGALRRTTSVPHGSYNVQAHAGRVLTPSLAQGTLTVLDATARVLERGRVAAAAHDACVVG